VLQFFFRVVFVHDVSFFRLAEFMPLPFSHRDSSNLFSPFSLRRSLRFVLFAIFLYKLRHVIFFSTRFFSVLLATLTFFERFSFQGRDFL